MSDLTKLLDNMMNFISFAEDTARDDPREEWKLEARDLALQIQRLCPKEPVDEKTLLAGPPRLNLRPIKNQDIWELYKQHIKQFWTVDEIQFGADQTSWNRLNQDEQQFLAQILAFFANSDNIVIQNLAERFGQEITLPEAAMFYGFQKAMEDIHVETYALCIEAVIPRQEDRDRLMNSVHNNPILQPKVNWAIKWITSDASLLHRLVAWTAVEGILFSASFASIFWFRRRGYIPGIGFANEKISVDESLHVKFAITAYHAEAKATGRSVPTETIHGILSGAVEVEDYFIEQALPRKIKGLSAENLKQYVRKVADVLCASFGVPLLYRVANPFPWMSEFSSLSKSNFFEKRVSEYVVSSRETKIQKAMSGLGQTLDF